MLTFSSLGGGTIRVTGTDKPLVIFPGEKEPSVKDAITFYSSPEEDTTSDVISWPGEYNEAGVSIRGIGHKEGQQVSYVVSADHIRIAFLASPLEDWTDQQLESVGDIDILCLPTDDAKVAQKLIDEFDPRILILTPSSDKDATETVLKANGTRLGALVEEHKVKSLPAEGREVVVMGK